MQSAKCVLNLNQRAVAFPLALFDIAVILCWRPFKLCYTRADLLMSRLNNTDENLAACSDLYQSMAKVAAIRQSHQVQISPSITYLHKHRSLKYFPLLCYPSTKTRRILTYILLNVVMEHDHICLISTEYVVFLLLLPDKQARTITPRLSLSTVYRHSASHSSTRQDR